LVVSDREGRPGEQGAHRAHKAQEELSASVKAMWSKLLDHIERTSPSLFHLLRSAEPVELSKTKISLRLPDQPFFRGEAENPQRLQALETACREVFGVEIPVRLKVAEGATSSALDREHIDHAARDHDRRREAMEHSMVRAALSEFEGARIATIKLHDDDTT
jgi:hypothetical protein